MWVLNYINYWFPMFKAPDSPEGHFFFLTASEQLDSTSKAKEGMASFAKVVPCVCLMGEAVRRAGRAAWVGVGVAGEDMGAEERDPGALSMPTNHSLDGW